MKLKLINAFINIREYMAEITTPDRRFRSGQRPTGKFEAKSNIEVKLLLEWNEEIQLRDVIATNEMGQFMVTEINRIDRICNCTCLTMNAFKHRCFAIQGELDVAIIHRVIGESSY